MAGIKGITIEIGANTSSVDRALKGIQESAGAVSRNLNLVKQDLKFEGGNSFAKMSDTAALAAQKVKSCDEKIQVLTKAAQENEKQFKLNNLSAKDYAANQAELQKRLETAQREQRLATSVMNDYQKKVDEAKGRVKQLADESLKLNGAAKAEKIGEMKNVLAVLREKADAAGKEIRELCQEIEANNKAFSKGERSVDEYCLKQEALGKALSEAQKKQKEANQEIKDVEKSIKKAESSFQQFIAHWKKSDEEIANAKEKHEAFWASVKANLTARAISAAGHGIINIFKGIGNAIKFAAAKVVELGKAGWSHFVETSKWSDELLTMSSVTRQSTTDLQKYQYALKFVDGDLNTLTSAMTRNIRTMGNARDASANTTTAYQALGVSILDANGELRNSNDVFWEAIDALGKIGNETERDELAMQLFGKSATELNPILEAGSENFRSYGLEAERLGLIMDEATIQRYGVVNDKLEMLGASFGSLKLKLAEVLLPFFEPFVEKVHQFVDEGKLKDLVDKYMPGLVQGAGDFGQKIVDFMTSDEAKEFVEEWFPKVEQFIKDLPENFNNAKTWVETNVPKIVENFQNVVNTISGIIDKLREWREFWRVEDPDWYGQRIIDRKKKNNNGNGNDHYSGRAAGGLVTAGVPYIVGERGQELFVPRIDGRILNAQQTQQVIHHYHNATTNNNYAATERDIQANLNVYLDGEKLFENQQRIAQRRGTSLLQGGGVR